MSVPKSPWDYIKYTDAQLHAIHKLVRDQHAKDGCMLDPGWMQEHNVRLGWKELKVKAQRQIAPCFEPIDKNKPSYTAHDKHSVFIKIVIPPVVFDPFKLSPESLTVEAHDAYPLSNSTKQRISIDPDSDPLGYSRAAIDILKQWQDDLVVFMAANPHLHDLTGADGESTATADEIRAILRNESDTSFRPLINSKTNKFCAHNRYFKARNPRRGEILTEEDPGTLTYFEHADFSDESIAEIKAVIKHHAYKIRLKPIPCIAPDGKTISYGKGIHNEGIGTFHINFGPIHVRDDGGSPQYTFTHYCDWIRLVTNGPDPAVSSGADFMAMFAPEPEASVDVSPDDCVSPTEPVPQPQPQSVPAVTVAAADPDTEEPDADAECVTLDATPLTPPSAGGDSGGKKRKRLKQLGRSMKSAAKKRAAEDA